MPVANGAEEEHFDMQLLGKLTLSVATVLFISWAYRFYSSRSRQQGHNQHSKTIAGSPTSPSSSSTSSKSPPSAGSSSPYSSHVSSVAPNRCSRCRVELRPRSKATPPPTKTSAGPTGQGVTCNHSPGRQVLKISVRSSSSSSSSSAVAAAETVTTPMPDKVDQPERAGRAIDLALAQEIRTVVALRSEERSQRPGKEQVGGSTIGQGVPEANKPATTSPPSPSVDDQISASPIKPDLPPSPAGPSECQSPGPEPQSSMCLSPVGSPNSPSGRRSPCVLVKQEGAIEVGRELVSDVNIQGSFSSFQSKAEVKVEEANLVQEGEKEGMEIRGKIYDYYVESSSHSVSDANTMGSLPGGHYHSGVRLLPQSPQLSCHGGSNEYPRTPSPVSPPLIIRDLVPSQAQKNDNQAPAPIPSPTQSSDSQYTRGLLRKDSYLMAAENFELLQSTTSMKGTNSLPTHNRTKAPSIKDGFASLPTQTTTMGVTNASTEKSPVREEDPLGNKEWVAEKLSLATVARAKFVQMPPTSVFGNPSWESLKGKLDLGNCLEALCLAKRCGHDGLRQACLRVMSDNYLQVLREPALYGSLRAGEREQIQRMRTQGRRCLVVADMEHPDRSWRTLAQPKETITSEVKPQDSIGVLYYYDDCEDAWYRLCNVPSEVVSVGSAMCTLDNYLFVAVGCQGSERAVVPSRRVFCFNPVTSIWTEVCPMNEARPHCKLVALQGCIYAVGGECRSTVERYDPRSDRWTFVAPLPNDTFAVAHRATACNGELFVSGGTLRYTLLRYSPKANVWRQSLIVGTKERTTEMVAVRSFLYRFDLNPTSGIHVYRYHAVARLWYECYTKRFPHCPAFQCVALGDLIYCVSRQFTMRFLADEVSPCFVAEDLKVLSAAKGVLFPFILALPDKNAMQTSV